MDHSLTFVNPGTRKHKHFNMRKKERFDYVLNYFAEHEPAPETELLYANPYQLLVAVILSAQCTDKRVNMITPLFCALS